MPKFQHSQKAKAIIIHGHKFICLASTEAEKVPTTSFTRESLFLNGLGEKKIFVPNIDEFHDVIYELFISCERVEVFELLRCLPSSRELEVIPFPVCHSPRSVRSSIVTAQIYLTEPIQNDL